MSKLPVARTPILFALTVLVTAALAAISYYIVELPFLRRKEPESRTTRTAFAASDGVHSPAAEVTGPALVEPSVAERRD